ncbi:MAG: hypothetical protein LBV41_09415 [Cytophagaceae bacterium]|jgi:hypothetical protein|nr:hypothetical protein [Cytophagaceae bacterium]
MAPKAKNKKKNNQSLVPVNRLKRTHRVTLLLNDKENEAVDAYCKKYMIESKTAFMRELILRTVMERFMDDYPSLFDKEELDMLIVKQNIQA